MPQDHQWEPTLMKNLTKQEEDHSLLICTHAMMLRNLSAKMELVCQLTKGNIQGDPFPQFLYCVALNLGVPSWFALLQLATAKAG